MVVYYFDCDAICVPGWLVLSGVCGCSIVCPMELVRRLLCMGDLELVLRCVVMMCSVMFVALLGGIWTRGRGLAFCFVVGSEVWCQSLIPKFVIWYKLYATRLRSVNRQYTLICIIGNDAAG